MRYGLTPRLASLPGFNPFNNLPCIGYYHNLEVNLHLVSGFGSDTFTRDFALCNKSADVIDERAGIPPEWFTMVTQRRLLGLAKHGNALIEPYSDELIPLKGGDNRRRIGEGPITRKTGKCEPLIRDYFKKYSDDKPGPVEQQS